MTCSQSLEGPEERRGQQINLKDSCYAIYFCIGGKEERKERMQKRREGWREDGKEGERERKRGGKGREPLGK